MIEINEVKNLIKTWDTDEVFLILDSNLSLTNDNAKELFLFLYDYTNSFKNSNTTPAILKLAWKILEYGINHDKLIVEKTKKTFSQMKLCKEIIKKIKLYNWWKIAWVFLDNETVEKYWTKMCIWDSFMSNLLITISWTELCFMIIWRGDWNYEVILGSKFDKNNIYKIQGEIWITHENRIINNTPDNIIKIILSN